MMLSVLLQRGFDGEPYYTYLLSGLAWTVALALLGWLIAFSVGVFVGCGRTLKNRFLAVACTLYVEIFRNIPVLVQMFLWYFVLPEILPAAAGQWIKDIPPPWSAFFPALICLGLYTASRIAEHIRAGIEALPIGQSEAALALGLRPMRIYSHVILPQALRLVLPSLTSEAMAIYKNTSVALTIGVMELTSQARQISEQTFQPFTAFGAATIIYLILALLIYLLMIIIDDRLSITEARADEPSLIPGAEGISGQDKVA